MFKKLLIGIIIVTLVVSALYGLTFSNYTDLLKENKGIQLTTNYDKLQKKAIPKIEIQGKYFIYSDTDEKVLIKGVNIGAGKPLYFPGEHGIKKEEYLQWFQWISEMGVNTIRIYTLHPPEFYEALYEFNYYLSDKPLYLIHGIWFEEEHLFRESAFNKDTVNSFEKAINNTIDVIHGNISIPEKVGYAFGDFETDVSEFVIGYIVGIEWEPEFVHSTDNKSQSDLKGTYLFTQDATPFEIFLAQSGEHLIDYEYSKYKKMSNIAFSNWVTTDIIDQKNEPFKNENLVSIDVRNIYATNNYLSDMFVSYHIYPYYPDGIVYDINYKNKLYDGKINPYRAYLEDLIQYYDIPVVVSEFGIPSSRGKAHENPYTGFNQGNIDEIFQGNALVSMFKDIFETGYAGGIVFSWQDEWFKRTWNTANFNIADRRAYWSDVQTNEQNFGLLKFESENKVTLDGNDLDWSDGVEVIPGKVYSKQDYAYLYLKIHETNEFLIGFDTLIGKGKTSYNNKKVFDSGMEFVLNYKDKEMELRVDKDYDVYNYYYSKLKILKDTDVATNEFNSIRLMLNYPMYLPEENKTLPYKSYVTGKFVEGTTDKKLKNYSSLSDFYVGENFIEIRIPWALLNFMDASSHTVMESFTSGDTLLEKKISKINVELVSNESISGEIVLTDILKLNLVPTLKDSYWILKEYLNSN